MQKWFWEVKIVKTPNTFLAKPRAQKTKSQFNGEFIDYQNLKLHNKKTQNFSQHSHLNPKSKLISSLPLPMPKSPIVVVHLPQPSHSHPMVKPTKTTTTAAFTLRRRAPIPRQRHRCRP